MMVPLAVNGPFATLDTLKVTFSGLALLLMIPAGGGLMVVTVPVKTTSDLWNAWSGETPAQEHACATLGNPKLMITSTARNNKTGILLTACLTFHLNPMS
jgi:hypothetical protein